ncbi:polyketide cyclase / dehydrase and lipid transport [Auraticoccus sp. F435]|uniref:Polyketide cyclase / dehydrase and lipid transport n=1 Tax=Auraticoccus cholistanensis TaxID=2656650 RepID=A0A6A9UZD7_9ACTN|nr:polyketide cyclase / dehydrase and lipid transport [Auraticoccus cholistanensis]MVA77342.1 polyketide cyclase / dehydrase and lipid transport [Auraticoccus cholistanensis]
MEAETFVPGAAAGLAPALASPEHLARWAPDLVLHPWDDRGEEGVRAVVSGVLVGRVEWWLERVEVPPGVHVHFWLAATPTGDGRRRPRRAGWLQRRHQRLLLQAHLRRWQAALRGLADQLPQDR